MERLDAIADPRHQGYVKYKSRVLLATRILSAIFYISSMRNASFQVFETKRVNRLSKVW